jgi:hypothetical protein
MSKEKMDKYDSQTFNCLQFGVITNIVILFLWNIFDQFVNEWIIFPASLTILNSVMIFILLIHFLYAKFYDKKQIQTTVILSCIVYHVVNW